MRTELRQLLLRQDGVLSRAQALEVGVTRRQIDHLLANGEWLRVHPRVYRLHAVAPSAAASVRAAALWLGPETLLAGTSAAWWWGYLPEPPASWSFQRPGPSHPPRARGIQVRRCFVDPGDRMLLRGVPVLSRPLTLLRAAVALEDHRPGGGIALLDRAQQQRWVDRADLQLAFRRNCGTWGTRAMRRLLDRTGDRAHSELERIAVRLLRAAGVTGFVLNHRTVLPSGRPVELDIAFPALGIALELDGYAYHASPAAMRADLQRANEIMAAGWVLRRFTYSDLLSDPDGFVASVRALLAS